MASANPLNEITDRLTHLYDSSEQSLYQPDYFDVTLNHCEVEVSGAPESESVNKFFVLEQAISVRQDRPYRVRLIKLEYDNDTDTIISKNFEPSDTAQFVGACSRAKKNTDKIVVSFTEFSDPKCIVTMKKQGELYVGGTSKQGCLSTHSGASTFSSEVTIGTDYISSWDRGWDSNGNQVWGAVKGPYVFKKVAPGDQAPDVVQMASYLVGHSTNQAQKAKDTSYAKIDYRICPIRIEGWDSQRNRIFYEEQEISYGEKSIVRARAYAMFKAPGEDITFKAFELTDEEYLSGFCSSDRPLTETVTRDLIKWDEQCEMNFQPSEIFSDVRGYLGNTMPGGCLSEFRGSKFLTITSRLTAKSFNIWERWWDADNNQVAGAINGPYIYVRQNHYYYDNYLSIFKD